MKVINEHGEECINLPETRIDQTAEIAFFLNELKYDKTVLLIHPTVPPHTSIEFAKKLGVDIIFQEQASHCVDLFEPTFASNWPIPFYYLANNLEFFYNTIPGIIYYPYWLLACRRFPDNKLTIGSEQDIDRKYFASSICRHPKFHRIYNFIKLRQKPYLDKIFWTFWRCNHIHLDRQPPPGTNLRLDEWTDFLNYYDNARYESSLLGDEVCIIETNWPAFTDSYINITSETYTSYKFTSEKSFKPFLAGQIPMIYGTLGANRLLANTGFDMFYDIINHDQYDNLETEQDRIDGMLKILDDLVDLDFEQIFRETVGRRKKNKEHLFSKDIEEFLMKSFLEKLDQC
jgi:hypothetical protein